MSGEKQRIANKLDYNGSLKCLQVFNGKYEVITILQEIYRYDMISNGMQS